MANNYKVKTYSNSTTGTSQALFTASAATTLVKSVIVNCDKTTPNVNAILRIKKSGGTEEMIKRQNITVQTASYEMLYDVMPLEVGDALYAQSDDTDITWIMSWVENTTSVIGQSIDVLSDVDTTGKANGDVLTYNSTTGNWEAEASAGGSSFGTIAVAGQSNVVADASNDTLTLAAANSNIVLTTNATTDTVTVGLGSDIVATTVSTTGAITAIGNMQCNDLGCVDINASGNITADNATLVYLNFTGGGTTTIGPNNSLPNDPADLEIRTNGNCDVVLDYDDNESSQAFRVKDGDGNVMFSVDEDGISVANGTSSTGAVLRLGEATANGTNYIGIQAPASLAANTTYTLPSADGTSGQVLATDSTGGLSWATRAANSFETIAVATQSDVVADAAGDTLTFAVAGGMSITTNATTDTITFDSKQLDTDDVTLQGARLIEMNGETLTLFDASGDIAIFTSDSVQLNELSVGSLNSSLAGYVQFLEASANGTNYVRIGAPTNLAASTTYTLPSADGSSGQVLSTNGTGGLSWATASASSYSTVRTQSGTSYTLALTDAGDYIQTTSTTAVTITVPLQSSVAWAADTEIYFEQNNTGQITIAGASGVTINSSETLKTAGRYSVIALKRVASDTWTLTGERQLA